MPIQAPPGGLQQPTRDELAAAIRDVIAHLTRQLEGAESLAPRVRGEDWSVADAAAHVAIAGALRPRQVHGFSRSRSCSRS